jgi:adenosylcobinamide kinase/adenosylcobinamide-phosphate guanylyltransferase
MAMPTIALLTGGGRSGKSRFAQTAALSYKRRTFIATAIGCDEEMLMRIARHQEERREQFRTVEAPVRLADAIRSNGPDSDVILIDCLTVWTSNLMYERERGVNPDAEMAVFLDALRTPPCDMFIVTNEVGMGIVPDNAMAREFRDLAGKLNQQVAAIADTVILMVSGLPLYLKGKAGL